VESLSSSNSEEKAIILVVNDEFNSVTQRFDDKWCRDVDKHAAVCPTPIQAAGKLIIRLLTDFPSE